MEILALDPVEGRLGAQLLVFNLWLQLDEILTFDASRPILRVLPLQVAAALDFEGGGGGVVEHD